MYIAHEIRTASKNVEEWMRQERILTLSKALERLPKDAQDEQNPLNDLRTVVDTNTGTIILSL